MVAREVWSSKSNMLEGHRIFTGWKQKCKSRNVHTLKETVAKTK